MRFDGAGSPLSSTGFATARDILGVDAATLWAFLNVESWSFGFLPTRRPHIHFERHRFRRLTGGRFDVDYPLLSNPVPGGYGTIASEYARLKSALTLDADAALQSASWGIGQLKGSSYRGAGYASVHELVEAMRETEDEQLSATATFIAERAMHHALCRHDWLGFARQYNGSGFGGDSYGARLADAHARSLQWLPSIDLRSVQIALVYLRLYRGPIDGVPGPRTHGAIKAFQRKRELAVTGRLDVPMTEALLDAAFAPSSAGAAVVV
jgi:hypothetical protein